MAGSAFKVRDTVAKVKSSFTPILVDGDDPANADFPSKYGLHSYPSIVFADLDGKVLLTLDGARPDSFAAAVEKLAK